MKIIVGDLEVFAHIGLDKNEMVFKQRLTITVTIEYHHMVLAKLRNVDDIICYRKICDMIKNFADQESHELLEMYTYKLLDFICQNLGLNQFKSLSLKPLVTIQVTKYPMITSLSRGVTCLMTSNELSVKM